MKHEKYTYLIHGYYWDEIKKFNPDGTFKITKTPTVHNQITLPIRIAMAGEMKGDSSFNNGISYHAIGIGNPAWDNSLVDPEEDDFPLVDEVFRKTPTSRIYLDEVSGLESVTPTRIIKVSTTFLRTDLDPLGVYIREQGLFGGEATSTKDSGRQINNIRHPRIWKDETVELTRNIRLEF